MNITKPYTRIILGFLLFAMRLALPCTATESPLARNFPLVDTVCIRAAKSLFAHPALPNQRLHMIVSEGTNTWVVRQHLMQAAALRGITHNDSLAPRCDIRISECGVRYAVHPSSADSLLRTVRVELRIQSGSAPPFTIAEQHQDAIARDDVPVVEIPKQDFTSAPVPPRPRSAWDDVLEPLVVAVSCIVIVGLLFTVRSQ